jgi:hypothetical protein
MDTTESRTFAARLANLLRNEQHAMADFLVALVEFDQRRGWITLGYSNLFDFLVRELGLARGTAHYRKTAAHLVQRYPEVLEALRQGNLCMSSIVELARVITPENRAVVLPRFFHCSKQEAKEISAELAPRPVVPRRDVVTAVRPSASSASTVSATAEGGAPLPPLRRPCLSPFTRLNSGSPGSGRRPRPSNHRFPLPAVSPSSHSPPRSPASTSRSPGRS